MLLLALAGTQLANAQTKDYKIQGLFIYSFAKGVEWPPEAIQGAYTVGVFSNAKAHEQLSALLKGRSLHNKSFEVKHFETVDDISDCHIFFYPISNKNNFKQVVEKIGKASTLIITEKDGLLKEGSIINLVITADGKMNYELNTTSAKS